jgi:hypothetical protein
MRRSGTDSKSPVNASILARAAPGLCMHLVPGLLSNLTTSIHCIALSARSTAGAHVVALDEPLGDADAHFYAEATGARRAGSTLHRLLQ